MLLGRYKIEETLSENLFLATKNQDLYKIERVLKGERNGFYLQTARKISQLNHENIVNFDIDEDDDCIYFIRQNLQDIEPLSFRGGMNL